jgi:hypothetical protein
MQYSAFPSEVLIIENKNGARRDEKEAKYDITGADVVDAVDVDYRLLESNGAE